MLRAIAKIIRDILLTIRRWFFMFIPEQSYLYMACGGINLVFDMSLFFISYHFIFHERNFVTPFFTFSPHIAALFFSFMISTGTGFFFKSICSMDKFFSAWQKSNDKLLNSSGIMCCNEYWILKIICRSISVSPFYGENVDRSNCYYNVLFSSEIFCI